MYPQPSRLAPQTLPINSQYMAPPYDFAPYHHMAGLADPSASAWNPVYREDYSFGFPGSGPGVGNFGPVDPGGVPGGVSGGVSGAHGVPGGEGLVPYNLFPGQDPFGSRRRAQEPAKPTAPSAGKTRTKEKYRVVYTDHQRQELENEFQFNRYITMRRKSELSSALSLSERQVKIWFQNRRAKERKLNKKKLQDSQQPSTSSSTPPVGVVAAAAAASSGSADSRNAGSPGGHILSGAMSDEYKMDLV
ncbi:homeobox protein CDX-1-like [Stigmatopora nigra]